jgi:septal ring factor EnvC (AmiA/AmiB activator)
MNTAVWNLRYSESEPIEGMILWNGNPGGIVAPPGSYFAKIKVGKDSAEVPFTIKADPNYSLTQTDYEQQFTFLKTVHDKFDETQKSLKEIRSLRSQINDFVTKQGKDVPKEIKAMADTINKKMTTIEETLYQTKAKSGQDVLNYPIRLNDKLSGVFDVANSGNATPSKQAKEVYADLAAQIDVQLAKLKVIKEKDIPAFNALIREKALPVIKPTNP